MSKKVLAVIGGILIVGVIVFFYAIVSTTGRTAELHLEVAPANSTLTINGKSSRGGVLKVRPGTHKVTASKDGFESATETVEISTGANKYVGLVLQPNTDKTTDWYSSHPEDANKSQGISSRVAVDDSKEAETLVPFIQELPFIAAGDEYRVDYGYLKPEEKKGAPVVFISTNSPEGRQSALQWIHYGGYDVSEFKVVFRPYEDQIL